ELPPPEANHNRSSKRIFLKLEAAIQAAHALNEAAELGEAFLEMGYRLGRRSWLVPDVSVTFEGQPEGKYIEGAPAIAVEVISATNTAEQVEVKIDLYFKHGAREVWVLYRKTKRIFGHVPGDVHVMTDRLTTPLLPGFVLDLNEVLGD